MLSRNFIFGFAVLCLKTSHSLPLVSFPINAQLPPVALVGQPFAFTFAPTTFTSALDLSYSARNLPVWLQFEASRRSFVGTPAQNDVGNVTFELEATDSEGNNVVNLTLVVLAKSSIKADQDLFAKQLSKSGTYSTPNSLLLPPETPFDLEIGPGVFESDGHGIVFYATSENHAPLPAWNHFDGEAVRFSGTTPSLLTPQSSPQIFNFSLVASQVAGFSQSAFNFQIAVTNHILAFVNSIQDFDVSAGSDVSIPPLIDQLHMDLKPVSRDQITKISCNQPDWLLLRSSDLSFYGTAPESINDTIFRLEVDDEFNNVANIDIRLLISNPDDMRRKDVYLGMEDIIVGQCFNYTFTDITSGAVEVDADLGLADSWLKFERTNVSVQGVVPSTLGDTILNISAIVRQNGQIVKVEHLTLRASSVSSGTNDGSSGSGTAVSQPTSTQTESPAAEAHNNSGRPVLALVIAVSVVVFLLVCLIAFLVRRSWKKRSRSKSSSPPAREISQITASENIVIPAEDDLYTEAEGDYRPPSVAPQVSIRWGRGRPWSKRPGSTASTGINASQPARSSWDEMFVEFDNPRGQSTNSRHRRHDPDSATIVNAKTSRKSSLSTPLPLATSRGTMSHTPLHADPGSSFTIDGRRTSGLGHDQSMPNTNMNNEGSTLRSTPLLPFSEPALLTTSVPGRSLTSENWDLLGTGEASSAFSGGKSIQRGPSFSSDGSRYENLEEQSYRAYKHRPRRPASIPFSLWEDEEWMTEDSASGSGNLQTQGVSHPRSRAPTGFSFEDSVVGQWDNGPHAGDTAVSHATSGRSERSQQSQTNSLRFI